MHHFDHQTIKDIEFDFIRDLLQSYCVQPTANLRMAELVPLRSDQKLHIELHRAHEFARLRNEGIAFPAIDFEELQDELKLLYVKDSVLSEESFERIYRANQLVNEVILSFKGLHEAFPNLSGLLQGLQENLDMIKAIRKVFDNRWQVKDDASPELAHIRSLMANVRRQVAKNFSRVLKELAGRGILGDAGESFVNGRKVLSVYSTHKRKVSGTVMGGSKTGSLTYIEPEANIELNFEVEQLADDERIEIRRILQQLTGLMRNHLPLLNAYQHLLVELDFLQAKTRLALELDAKLPIIEADTVIDLKNAYHPVLLLQNKKLNKRTLPQTVLMDKSSRMLVISGPNAGGKSITMKTIGLLQVMLQCGLLVPASEKSRMSFFNDVLTDIGDNQSIENQLSTYSYRLKRMKHFLDVANRRSLVLLDEFGTGSDPDLGGALAEVFFEELYNKKSFGVITTHYTNIKLKAANLKNAVNGCMLFNKETLEPTYKLSIGEPGSSFTFEVAEINGIPHPLVAKAKTLLSDGKVKMDSLLSSLQEEKTRLESMTEQARVAANYANTSITDFEKKKEKYEDRLQKQQETIERNNKFLAHGKRLAQIIENFNTRPGKAISSKNKILFEDIQKYVVMQKTKMEEERKVKKAKGKEQKANESTPAKDARIEPQPIKVGSLVKLQNTKQTGTVLELVNGRAVVAIGVFKTKVNVAKLEWIR